MKEALRSNPFSLAEGEIARVREALDAAGFEERAVAELCGATSIAALKDVPFDVALARTGGDTPLDLVTRLYVIGAPCAAARARAALGPLPLERWVEGGLLGMRGDQVSGTVKLVPLSGLVVAFDRNAEGPEAADHVMGPSDSARLLANLTLRERCRDSLDVGTGCGFLALLLARHSERVVATDLNARAVAFTDFNARLNAMNNVQSLTGDLFAPVSGRRFELVTSNPPFVISPEERLLYLSGGQKADTFCRRVAREVPAVLADGGCFQMLCNWVEHEDGAWQARLRSWFEGTGCDAWVLRSSTTDPVSYARAWMKVGTHADAREDPARLEAWLRYYEEERITGIGAGVVTMRKRGAGAGWFRVCDAPAKTLGPAGDAVARRLGALDFLEARADDAALFASVLAVSPDARLTQECHPTADGWAQESARVRLVRGLAYEEEVDTYVGELIVSCDGRRTLAEAVARAAGAVGWAAADVPEETAAIVRQLVEEGFLLPVEPTG